MNDNDAIEQAYRNGQNDGYKTGRRYGVCEFEAYLFIWECEHGDIKSVDLPKLRETYLELVERSAKK